MKRFGRPMRIVAVIAVTSTLAATWFASAMADRPLRKGILERMEKAPIRPEDWALELTFDRRVYRPGEDILLTEEFVNLSEFDGQINLSHWQVNHWLEVESWGGHGPEPLPTALGERHRRDFGSLNRNRNDPVWLGPGERWGRDRTLKLNTLYDFGPGYYRVRVTYYDEHGRGGGPLKLVSDWARFRIAAE
jgi:hypothetical protein